MQNKHLFQLLVHAFFLEFQSSPVVASSKLPSPFKSKLDIVTHFPTRLQALPHGGYAASDALHIIPPK